VSSAVTYTTPSKMVVIGYDIRLPSKGERMDCVENLIMAGAEHLRKRIGTRVPDLLPITIAGCAHNVAI
jgi:hypothetical protein